MLSDLAAKDDGDLVGLTDGAVGIQESIPQSIEGSSAMENEIIAILDLSKEEAMLTAGLFALLFLKKEVKPFSHLRAQTSRSCAVRESASSCSRLGSWQRRKALVVC